MSFQGDKSKSDVRKRKALATQSADPIDATDFPLPKNLEAIRLLGRMGNFPGAEPLYREALALQKKLLSEKNSAVARSLEGLGLNLFDQGNNHDDAVALVREAVAMQRDLYSGPHPDLAEALNNLGFVTTDSSEAELLFRESLAMKQILYSGEAHPEIAMGLVNVAYILYSEGKYDESEEMYRAAYEMQR
jgi:tetratricopeptide (TPR) repeat protein